MNYVYRSVGLPPTVGMDDSSGRLSHTSWLQFPVITFTFNCKK